MTVRNGLTLAYMVALVNATLALMLAFGVSLSEIQQASIVGFVNAAVLLVGRVLHLPEQTPTGTVRVAHVPVLEERTTVTATPAAVVAEPAVVEAPPAAVVPPAPAG